MPLSPSELKSELRARQKAGRLALAPERKLSLDLEINRRLGEVLLSASVIGFYYPLPGEADVLPALAAVTAVTCLPVMTGQGEELEFCPWRSGDALASGSHGVREPARKTNALEPDILLVPLLAFDRMGRRLGYGGGYYDATLARLRARKSVTAIGIAYGFQETVELPEEVFDQRLDQVVTEKEVIVCRP